jgi:hypothetical protein
MNLRFKVVPKVIGDPIAEVLFMVVQPLIPVLLLCLLFVLVMYVIYLIIILIIPENILGIPIRAILLALPPFPDLISTGIFDLFSFIIKVFFSGETIINGLKSVTFHITLFAVQGSSYILAGIFPGYDSTFFVDLLNNKKDLNDVLYKLIEIANDNKAEHFTEKNYLNDDDKGDGKPQKDYSNYYEVEKTNKDTIYDKSLEQCILSNNNLGTRTPLCKLQNQFANILIERNAKSSQ